MTDILENVLEMQGANIALAGGDVHTDQTLKKIHTVSDTVAYANLTKAHEHRNKTSIRQFKNDRYYKLSVCGTSLASLGEYGVGLELYFHLIKQFMILFFIISCISL